MSSNTSVNAFLPAIREAVREKPEDFGNMEIDCHICYRSIVLGEPFLVIDDPPDDDDDPHCRSPVALFCGHAFGLSCIMHWVMTTSKEEFPCPTCRQICSLGFKNNLYPIKNAQKAILAPNCLPEGGSPPDLSCFDGSVNIFEELRVLILECLDWEAQIGLRTNVAQFFPAYLGCFALVLQNSWDYTTLVTYYIQPEGPILPMIIWTGDTAAIRLEGLELVSTSGADLGIPKCTYPLFVTQDDDGSISRRMKAIGSAHGDVWAPTTTGFGVGFINSFNVINRDLVIDALSSPHFAEALFATIAPVMSQQGMREAAS